MLVYDYFPGDDLTLASQQHDVYGFALDRVVEGCREHVSAACRILDLPIHDHWPDFEGYDHRTMQVAHDILAAVWRFTISPPQHSLAIDKQRITMGDWLDWLTDEVRNWRDRPDLVHSVVEVLRFQNSPRGYAAEDILRTALLKRFDQVPWESGTASRRQW